MSVTNFLDVDSSVLDKRLRFVNDELEDEFKNIIENQSKGHLTSHLPYKIVQPDPGFCIKTYKPIDNEKLFLNICQSDGIPPPENITTEQLGDILNTDSSSFKVPMSITEIRQTKDKSNKLASVCDIAINPRFYEKIERIELFREFFYTIIAEAMETKYNIKVDQSKWIVLKNRKFVGSLISHRVQNRDVRKVLESYKNPRDEDKKLLEELSGEKKSNLIVELATTYNSQSVNVPQHRLAVLLTNDLVAEFLLPGVASDKDIILDLGEDCIVLSCPKNGYSMNHYFDYKIDQSKSYAKFDDISSILTVTMPICL
ncbi:PIH1 domain-containing protein 1 [Pseudolycoriella hygida]|uniref:PIH1 domain-containing protein 1 n=1 Tax=Pseudolycoriella hygida TaxID=35572 RepID=A0A9Q0ND65_9DIPT|nr:PIH1 domain-containing protein 1 [Pseudolycoriella hygida]